MNIRLLDAADIGYAIDAWQQAHMTSPSCRRAPRWAYRIKYGTIIKRLADDPSTRMLGAYDERGLLGFLVMTPGKRVRTVHWCHTRLRLNDRTKLQSVERRVIFFALLDAADLGSSFAYTFQGPRVRKETGAKSLDQLLVADLRARGVTATYISIEEYLK